MIIALQIKAGHSVLDVLLDVLSGNAFLLAAQKFALELHFEDQGSKQNDVLLQAYLFQNVLLNIIISSLVKSLLETVLGHFGE